MRKILTIVLAMLALTVVLPASASQSAGKGAERALRHGLTAKGFAPQGGVAPNAASDAFVSNDDFFTQTLNHFGNPALGSVVGESWIESGFNDAGAQQNLQGITRTILLPKALRTSIKVQIFGLETLQSDPVLLTSSSTVNSGTNRTVQVGTPELGALATNPHCFFFASATIGIRWSDQRLSSVVLEPAVVVANPSNPNCAA